MEPPEKLFKTDENELKGMLMSMQSSFISKLKCIEEKIEGINSKYHLLEEKVENILLKVKESTTKAAHPNSTSSEPSLPLHLSSNSEDIYPNGSWLGNPNDADLRVRCSIHPTDLETINTSCFTAEKMAVTLLDHLFDRETQAESNISGTGKHGKKQLDPMKIHGIKCHVIHMFRINVKEWMRIRQNLDSKCRTAFRRKRKGLPLKVVKSCRERSSHTIHRIPSQPSGNSQCDTSLHESSDHRNLPIPKTESQTLEFVQEHDLGQILPLKLEPHTCSLTFTDAVGTQIIHTEHGDIQVIQATEEQLEQLKQSHHIEILSPADILPESVLASTD